LSKSRSLFVRLGAREADEEREVPFLLSPVPIFSSNLLLFSNDGKDHKDSVVQKMEAANILKEVVAIISRACIKKVALVSTQILPGFNMCYLYIRS
jgi:hypothetical protein